MNSDMGNWVYNKKEAPIDHNGGSQWGVQNLRKGTVVKKEDLEEHELIKALNEFAKTMEPQLIKAGLSLEERKEEKLLWIAKTFYVHKMEGQNLSQVAEEYRKAIKLKIVPDLNGEIIFPKEEQEETKRR